MPKNKKVVGRISRVEVPGEDREPELIHERTVERGGRLVERYRKVMGSGSQIVYLTEKEALQAHSRLGVRKERVRHAGKPTKAQRYEKNPHEPIKI